MTPSPGLVQRLTEDFDLLQAAVLDEADGRATPDTVAALADPTLTVAKLGALIHAATLARGEVRRAQLLRLGHRGAEEHRRAVQRLGRVTAARKQAAETARHTDHRASVPHPRAGSDPLPLAVRVLKTAMPRFLQSPLDAILAERGFDPAGYRMPDQGAWRWWDSRLHAENDDASRRLPAPVEDLNALSDEDFVRALLADAREAENPYLAHDAVVERWAALAGQAQAWGRYAVAQAERQALTHATTTRAEQLDALEAAYADLAVLNLRAHEARQARRALLRTIRVAHAAVTSRLLPSSRTLLVEAFERAAGEAPAVGAAVRALADRHQADCPHAATDCPACHHELAAHLTTHLATHHAALLTGPLAARPGAQLVTQLGAFDEAEPAPTGALRHADFENRYALLSDLPADVPWAVSDAAVVTEDSALCGWGWAAADGTVDWGSSYASSSGEAELIALCEAALDLLARNPEREVLVLSDSSQAVDALAATLATGDPSSAHRCALFPEARARVAALLPHRDRVQVRWLKGHVGHDLNESADALARLALRHAIGRVTAAQLRQRLTEIRRGVSGATPPRGTA